MQIPESLFASKATSKTTRDARAEVEALVERDRQHVRAVAAAERDLARAEADETTQSAAAIRAGKPMPATKLDEQRAELERMRREAAALVLAVKDSRAAYQAAIVANRAAWQKAHEGVVAQRRAELTATLDRFVEADNATREALAVDAFLSGRPQRRVGPMSSFTRPNGEPYSAAQLAAELRIYAAGDVDIPEAPSADELAAENAAHVARAEREAEMMRQHIARGGSYSDQLHEVQDHYTGRGTPRAA